MPRALVGQASLVQSPVSFLAPLSSSLFLSSPLMSLQTLRLS